MTIDPNTEETIDLEEASRRIKAGIVHVGQLRRDPLIAQIIRGVDAKPELTISAEETIEEIRRMTTSTRELRAFSLDGTDGLQQANVFAAEALADRTRLVAIARTVRYQALMLTKLWKRGLQYIRSLDGFTKLTKTVVDDIAALVLEEVTERLSQTKTLLDLCADAIEQVDRTTEHVDRWFRLHAQHARMTYFQRTGRDLSAMKSQGF